MLVTALGLHGNTKRILLHSLCIEVGIPGMLATGLVISELDEVVAQVLEVREQLPSLRALGLHTQAFPHGPDIRAQQPCSLHLTLCTLH